jgi:hypothetical protein
MHGVLNNKNIFILPYLKKKLKDKICLQIKMNAWKFLKLAQINNWIMFPTDTVVQILF